MSSQQAIQAQNQAAVDAVSRKLKEYVRVTGKTAFDVMDKKGNDLRIQMFRGMFEKKFGGRRKGRNKTIAYLEFARRSKAGSGIKVRSDVSVDGAPAVDKNGKPLSEWQRKVWGELAARTKGQGLLGIAFLKNKWSKPGGRIVRNKMSRKLGMLAKYTTDESVLANSASFTLEGFVDGSKTVSDRYGIAAKALSRVGADIDKYLARKLDEAAKKHFQKAVA